MTILLIGPLLIGPLSKLGGSRPIQAWWLPNKTVFASAFVEVYPKIFENQQISRKSILRRWYTQIPISYAHGSNKRQKISHGDGLGGESPNFQQ